MNPFNKKTNQVSIFITAGYPEQDSLTNQITELERSGVDFIEVGIPFSDPMADGPVIQHSSAVALKNGMSISLMFSQIEATRTEVPLVIMSYLNPIMHFGIDTFLLKCRAVHVKHVIIPDVSLEIYDALYRELFESMGVCLCFLITPQTESERIREMAARSQNGFLYLVSSSMTTGSETQKIPSIKVQSIRKVIGSLPLMIGFGIKTKDDVEAVHEVADGAIIGSAYIQSIENANEKEFISKILAPL